MGRSSFSRLSNTTAGSSKSFTVPAGVYYELLYAHCVIAASATAGNRLVVLAFLDDTDAVVFDTHCPIFVTASQTMHVEYFQGTYREGAFAQNTINIPIPIGGFVFPGWKIVIKDDNTVSAADVLTFNAVVKKVPT